MNAVIIRLDKNTSHSSVLKQLIDQLLKQKFASRIEIEDEFISLLETRVYRTTVD